MQISAQAREGTAVITYRCVEMTFSFKCDDSDVLVLTEMFWSLVFVSWWDRCRTTTCYVREV
jgi:hypothetical protein